MKDSSLSQKTSNFKEMKTNLIPEKIRIVIFILLTLVFSSCATTKSQHDHTRIFEGDYDRITSTMTYRNLAILDLDQVSDLLQDKINQYNRQSSVQPLKEGAFVVFARPDEDTMVEKVLSHVQTPLEEENEWENTIVSLVRQSIDNMKNDKISAQEQVTAGVVLENIVSEFKPSYIKQYRTGGFETEVINHIADSNVTYSKAASKERGLYLMRNNLNPSQIAKKIVSQKQAYLDREDKK